MQRQRTTFIIGAGASAEVGLPVGERLKDIISKEANFSLELGRFKKGNHELFQTIQEMSSKNKPHDRNFVNVYLRSARSIFENMPLSISIDNFLDSRRSEVGTIELGKLLIAHSILLAEQSSKLCIKRDQSAGFERVRFEQIVDTWYIKLFQIITEQAEFDQIPELLSNIEFVIFNYDRCVEHFLFHALKQYYSKTDAEVSFALKYLRVLRPYGSIGPLPWQEYRGVPYGQPVMHEKLIEVSENLRIFTEQIEDDNEEILEIRKAIKNADTIVFLGFGFHHQNLRLINPGSSCSAHKVVGTASGISDSDASIIEASILTWFEESGHEPHIRFEQSMYCDPFFRNYWRTLARFQ